MIEKHFAIVLVSCFACIAVVSFAESGKPIATPPIVDVTVNDPPATIRHTTVTYVLSEVRPTGSIGGDTLVSIGRFYRYADAMAKIKKNKNRKYVEPDLRTSGEYEISRVTTTTERIYQNFKD